MSTRIVNAELHRESLRDYWLPLEFADRISDGEPYGTHVLGRPVVLFRDETGAPRCLEDHCPHRGTPLSLGSVDKGRLRCGYHGWEFDGCGRCTRIPSVAEREIRVARQLVKSLPAAERDGLVWVWPGNPDSADEMEIPVPSLPPADEPFAALKEHYEIQAHYSLLSANLSDPAHVQFVHKSVLAKIVGRRSHQVRFLDVKSNENGWPTGRTEVNNDGRINYYQYEYQSPFLITKTVNGWFGKRPVTNFHWEYAVPLKRDLTRFFFFQYRTFFNSPFAQFVMGPLYRRMANRVTDEDRQMLEAQQSRLEQGAVFQALVPADRLLRQYHRKVNAMEGPEDWFSGFGAPLSTTESVSQSAARDEGRLSWDERFAEPEPGAPVVPAPPSSPDSPQPR